MQNNNRMNSGHNSKSPQKDTDISPVSNLFKNNDNIKNEGFYEGNQEPIKDIFESKNFDKKKSEIVYENIDDPSLNLSGMKKWKSRFRNFILAMSQNPEENFEDDGMVDDIYNEPTVEPLKHKEYNSEKASKKSNISTAKNSDRDMKIYTPSKDKRNNTKSPIAEEPKPKEKTKSPVAEEPKPKEKAKTPAAEESKPKEKTKSPVAEEPKQKEKTKSPVAEEPKPKEKTKSPVAEEPKPKEKTETPVTEEPKPKEKTKSPIAEEPKPKGKTETPVTEESKSKEKTETPVTEEPKPKEKTGTPAAEESKPKEKTETPAAEEPKPKEKTKSPIAEEPKPKEKTKSPVAEEPKPEEKTKTPVAEESKPKENMKTPVAEESKPKEKTKSPAAEEPKPKEKTKSLIAEEPKPKEKTKTPIAEEKKNDEKKGEIYKRKTELPEYDIFSDNADSPTNSDKNVSGKKDIKKQNNADVFKSPDSFGYNIKSVTAMVEEQIKSGALSENAPKAERGKKNKHKNRDGSNSAHYKGKPNTLEDNVNFNINTDNEKNSVSEQDKSEKSDSADNVNTIYKSGTNTEKIHLKKNKNVSVDVAGKKDNSDDDIVIIPWNGEKREQKPEKEPVSDSGESSKDFAEGYINGVRYHESRVEPFVVMAGKFTKTLRSEYEYIRIYNKAYKENQKAEEAEKENNKAENEKTVKAVNEEKDNTAQSKRSKFEPIENPRKREKSKSDTRSGKKIEHLKPVKSENDSNSNSAKSKPQMPEMRKKKKKFSGLDIKQIFNDEEEYDPEENVEEEKTEKPLLDDYNEEKDADEIRTEIGINFHQVLVRSGILFAMSVISVIMVILAQCTPLFRESMRNGWLLYAVICFILFSISVIVSRMPIVNGLMPLRYFKGNSDTAVSVAAFAVAIQSVTAIFTPNIFVNGIFHIYTPLVIIALLLNSLGKLLIIIRTRDNFKFLVKPYPKFAGKIYTDIRNAEKMVSEFPNKKTIIAYTRRSKFMSNFLQLSYIPDPSEEASSKAAPITTLIAIACGLIYGLLKMDFTSGVSSFALTACVSTPLISLLAINIPMLRLCRNSLRSGAMVTSYETVKQFCDTNAIMLDSSQLYPKGTVTLSGMKAFKQSKLNDAITAGAAVMYAVNGTMCGVFENIVQCGRNMLPRVDSVVYEDEKGLVGWVEGQRILIGNRELLESHNIKAPDKSLEDRYRDDTNEISYITVGGELIAMFVLAYKPDREIVHELRNLEENGVSFIIRTVDPNISKESVARNFYLYHRCITILPTGLGNICHEVTSSVDDRSRAYLVTRGKISSFAKAVSGCIRIKSNVTISKIMQYVAVVVGLVLITVISFISGFEKLGCLEMLIYLGFWAIASIVVSMIRK